MARDRRTAAAPDDDPGLPAGYPRPIPHAAILARDGIHTTRQTAAVCFAAIGDVLNGRLGHRDASSIARLADAGARNIIVSEEYGLADEHGKKDCSR